MRRYIRGVLALGLAASLSACLDLNVINENLPDRRRALSNAGDVENILGISTFRRWYNTPHGLANIAGTFPNLSDEGTNTLNSIMNVQWSQEPRIAFRNDDLSPQIWMPRAIYADMSECVANTNDGLAQIKEGMRIKTLADPASDSTTDNTARAFAWGKLWQGQCLGMLGLSLDRFPVATEDDPLPEGWEELAQWEKEKLSEGENWRDGIATAIESLERAIEVADTAQPFLTPDAWVPGNQINNDQLEQLAHTMIARLMVYSARYPEDRETVDWQKVLFHTERGLTYNWGPVLADGVITDPSYLARLGNTGSTGLRADYRLIGPADQSGNYQAWLNTVPHDQATRFLITTPDRRITGATPTSNGAYFRYLSSTGSFDVNRGLQHFSFYQWNRRANYGGFNSATGKFVLISVDENRLLRAEAMYRLGRLQEAADLINVTRTRAQTIGTTVFAQNLPPVTPAGVPTVNGQCVPRRKDGTCGSLLDALMWERDIELVGHTPLRSWWDRRGFGQLQPGTFVHMPIPARYLVTLGVPLYTFGGVGGEGAAR